MELHEVERLDAQVLARAIVPGAEVLERVVLGPLLDPAAHLRRHEQVLAALGQKPADEPLAAAVAVDVGGVDERHARVHGRPQHAERVVLGHRAPIAAELPRAQADDTDLPARTAEDSLLHGARA